jgi:hypothetical protein
MKVLSLALRVIIGLVGLLLGGLLGGLLAYLSLPVIEDFAPREAAVLVGIGGGTYLGLMMMWAALDLLNADI